jgi:hypothetical protein
MSATEYTVGDLRRLIQGLSDETRLSFGGGLTVYRAKRCADDEVYLEWNEPFADLYPQFRKRNPHIKVAFVTIDDAEWNDQGLIGKVDVSIR